jgi:hypothetical protein
MSEVAGRVLTAPINLASMALTTTCRYPTFASLVANSIAPLISGDSGAEALADEGEPRVEHLSNKVPEFSPTFDGGNTFRSRLSVGGNGSAPPGKHFIC